MKTAEELSFIYTDISLTEQDILTTEALIGELINSNHEIVIGMNIIKESNVVPPNEPTTAYVNSNLGMIGIQINKQVKEEEPYTWVVDEVTAVRLLGVLHDSLKHEIVKLKKELK